MGGYHQRGRDGETLLDWGTQPGVESVMLSDGDSVISCWGSREGGTVPEWGTLTLRRAKRHPCSSRSTPPIALHPCPPQEPVPRQGDIPQHRPLDAVGG